MRRIAGLVLVTLLVTACTPAAEEAPPQDAIASLDPSAQDPTPSLPPTPAPARTLEANLGCDGLGRVPSGDQITFVRGNRLLGVSPDGSAEKCLADLSSSAIGDGTEAVSWNAPGDRVIVSDRAISRDLATTRALTGVSTRAPVWSRPTGTSVVWISEDGRLMKRSSFGGKATDISFLGRHDDVTYHPAGTHIVTTGLADDGSYGLYLATNIGTDQKLLARGEQARFITNLKFGSRHLFYTARHGPQNWHLHSLTIGKDAFLSTIAKGSSDFIYAVSEFDTFDPAAWSVPGDCGTGEPDKLKTNGLRLRMTDALKESSLQPVGWLVSSELVVASKRPGCGDAPRDLYVLSHRKDPVLIAEGIEGSVALRQPPPPTPPPPGEEQEVVA